MSERAGLARALLLVAALHLVGLGALPLLEPDEGRYADVTLTLVRAPSVVPRVNGVAFVDKPPLVPWLAALSVATIGKSALALRLVPALFGIGGACVAAWLAREIHGKGAALAALVYATCPLALGVGRTFVLDLPLAALVAIGLGLVLKGAGSFRSPPSHACAALGGVAIGLATLVKGPVAIGLAGLGVISALAVSARRGESVARFFSPLPWLVALAVSAPWFALAERAEPGFLNTFLLGENLVRFGGKSVEHTHGPFFFLGVLGWGLGPWLLVLPGLFLAAKAGKGEEARGRAALLGFAALVVIFFSFSSTKVETYILPAFPALAAVIGGELERALGQDDERTRRALSAAFSFAANAIALACFAGVVVGTGAITINAGRAYYDFERSCHPLLALLPLPFFGLAHLRAWRAKPRGALFALALALVAAIPFALEPARAVAHRRSAEELAAVIAELRAEAKAESAPLAEATVASYHYYYRGLPYYLEEPVVLLGEKGELHDDAFASRPDLFVEDKEDRIERYLKTPRPNGLIVVMPAAGRNQNDRPARFREACERAGVSPMRVPRALGDDEMFVIQ